MENILVLKEEYVNLYNKKMEEIEKDIWDIIDKFEYYKKIRGIMKELQLSKHISKRQAIRLYEFLMGKPQRCIKKIEINEIYNNISKEIFENVQGGNNNEDN